MTQITMGLVAASKNPLGLHGVVQWPKELIHKMPGDEVPGGLAVVEGAVRGKGGRVFAAL